MRGFTVNQLFFFSSFVSFKRKTIFPLFNAMSFYNFTFNSLSPHSSVIHQTNLMLNIFYALCHSPRMLM